MQTNKLINELREHFGLNLPDSYWEAQLEEISERLETSVEDLTEEQLEEEKPFLAVRATGAMHNTNTRYPWK